MRIQVWDYRNEYEHHRDEILAAVDRVFRSGRLILGESVKALECELASYCGVSHGVGVNSGTDALFLALKGLGLRPGAEVITVANTAVPTVAAIVSAGGIPRFVDIDPDTYLMAANRLEAAVTSKTACILPVHLYGQCVLMEPVLEVARRHGLTVLEDCAQSTGAKRNGVVSGAFGDVSAFSFYPTKILGGYGDGGMVLTNRSDVADKVRRLRMYGMDREYYSIEHGYNSRLDEVQAEILRCKLKRLDDDIRRRQVLAQQYESALVHTSLILPKTAEGNEHAYYVYVVRHPERDRIIKELATRDIVVNVSYPYPISIMEGYASLGYKEGDLPVTERAAKEIFSLPMYPTLTDEQQQRVCQVLSDILA